MSILYIKDIKKSEEILSEKEKKLPQFMRNILVILKIRLSIFQKNNNLIILPIRENQELSTKKIEKIIKNIMKKNVLKTVVLNKRLNNNEQFKNILNSHNIDILNGRYLFRFMIFDIVNFILDKKNKKLQDIELSIMVNELDEINIKTILVFARKVKRLNIITNHIGLFKRVEQSLYDEGIMIMVSNNKKKSLLKSDIIVNVDFVEENFKEYRLNNNCTIVNVSSDIEVYNKGFNGININNYNISYDNDIIEKYSYEFDCKLLYESKLYGISDFHKILTNIEYDNVIISELIGNNGRMADFCV